MPTFNDARVRKANDRPVNRAGGYVLYWSQAFRRLRANHALDYALHWCRQLKLPLVVYEGLRLDYPWASARTHRLLLDGVRDSAAEAARLGVNYWPFVETPDKPARGLVRKLAADAAIVVTDDYPQFVVPAQTRAVAARVEVAVHAIDGNSLVPLSLLGPPTAAAAHLRPKIRKLFVEAWHHRAAAEPDFPVFARRHVNPLFRPWTPPADLDQFVHFLPVDPTVPPLPETALGATAARGALHDFVAKKLPRYAGERNEPDDPDRSAASGLSAFLRHGHLSIQEVCEAVLGPDWTPAQLNPAARGRDDYFCRDPNVNAFLDEAIVWRDVGYQWHHAKLAALGPTAGTASATADAMPSFNFRSFDFTPIGSDGTLPYVLPAWARASLERHAADRRGHLYTLDRFEHADTHDPLWNAAQTQLVATGRIHNYLRMLWGKKVLEWSASPEEGYRVLEHLNNKYAADGRDPNSYTGVLWCFGLFDRPWPPDREVFGTVRYMSCENTARKFDLDGYLEYVAGLPSVADVRSGRTARRPAGLF